jgi:hypothetical protein
MEDSVTKANLLKGKIKELKKADKNYSVFGSNYHGYRFNSCLSLNEIESFESKFKVRLPEDYRNFLLIIGNGGCGPYYGINELENSYTFVKFAPTELAKILETATQEELFAYLNKDFPYTEDPKKNEEILDNLLEDWEPDDWKTNSTLRGSLAICHQGCGYYNLLEVSGEKPGRIWFDGRVSDGPLIPESDSFYNWYLNWVNNSLSDLKNKRESKSLIKKFFKLFS